MPPCTEITRRGFNTRSGTQSQSSSLRVWLSNLCGELADKRMRFRAGGELCAVRKRPAKGSLR